MMLEWLGMPVAGAAHAGEVDELMALVHWLMLVLFVGWSIFFVYVLVRFRRKAHPVASHEGVRGRWSTWLEGGVLVAEVVLLAFFSIPVWSARVDAFPPLSAWLRSSSRGTSTTRDRTDASGGPSSRCSTQRILSASIAMIPRGATTLRRSTSFSSR
jgi:heme/copper-type cytochrome/quinol oxidase subunit 2